MVIYKWTPCLQKKCLFFSAISLFSLPKASINIPICGRPKAHMCRPCYQAHGQVISIHQSTSCHMCSIIPRRASQCRLLFACRCPLGFSSILYAMAECSSGKRSQTADQAAKDLAHWPGSQGGPSLGAHF